MCARPASASNACAASKYAIRYRIYRFGTFRKRVWKYEAKFRPDMYADDIGRMSRGLAPKDSSGISMQLHHVVGKGNDMYNVVKLTRSQHALFHKTYGYRYNSNWSMQSLIDLFG